MPGEHWCSICEDSLSKHKGTYVKLSMRGIEDRRTDKISIVCPDCSKKDKVIAKGLKLLEDVAKPVEVSRGRVCSFCGNRVKKRERCLRADFRYNGTELRADVCEACIDDDDAINAIHVNAPNPDFNVKVNCLSAGVCGSFKKPGKYRGINCINVVANLDGELYCRKAHPGHVRIYRERHAFPPSRRQLMKMLTVLGPMFEKLKNEPLLAELKMSLVKSELMSNDETAEAIKEERVADMDYNTPCYKHETVKESDIAEELIELKEKLESELTDNVIHSTRYGDVKKIIYKIKKDS